MRHLNLRYTRALISHVGLAVMLLIMLLPGQSIHPTAAQVMNGPGFASAQSCLLGQDTFASTRFANTIYTGSGSSVAGPSDPALLGFTAGSAYKLADLGSSSRPGLNSPITNGVGSVYGLAYDDGSVSGIRRLFAAAFLKRTVAFGPGSTGGIYEYRFDTGTWRQAATVSNSWSGPGRAATDTTDAVMLSQVGKQSLGDIEISPDGRTLYVMNLSLRRIERFDISGPNPVYTGAIDIPLEVISSSAAVRADLRPFALEFFPEPRLDLGGPLLTVGVVDSAERSPGGGQNWIYPRAYVLSYALGSGQWQLALSQDLNTPALATRHVGSYFLDAWQAVNGFDKMSGWNPWRSARSQLPVVVVNGIASVHYPQPLLTDIEFNRDGQAMYLGLRDRLGDQVFQRTPPVGELTGAAQGDVLAYRLVGNSWQLQGSGPADFFADNTHTYPGAPAGVPAHIENMMGAMATSPQGAGPNLSEQMVGNALFGSSTSGMRFYSNSGGSYQAQLPLTTATDASGGKASALGDVELLCSYAFVGGRIWQDTNNNGLQDIGEPPLPGITLELLQGSRASDPPLASVITGADGRYLFAVPANTAFNIRLAANSRASLANQGWRLTAANIGGNDRIDSDIVARYGYIEFAGVNYGHIGGGSTGAAIAMPMRESGGLDGGESHFYDLGLTRFQPTGELGDRVWNDLNRNGLQDSGEPGIAGVPVTLRPDPNSMALLPGTFPQTVYTDASGAYYFRNIAPGFYTVTIAPPTGYSATLRDAESNTRDDRDSDTDATSGYSSPLVELGDPPQHFNRNIDFGLVGSLPDVSVEKSGPSQVLPNQSFSYSISYANTGTTAAADVQLVDTLPAGLTYLSASPAPAGVSGRTLRWNLGTLNPGSQGSITLNVRAPASIGAATSQPITNQVIITTSSPGDNPGNNNSSSTGSIVRPELRISKAAPSSALVGDEFSYRLTYANDGAIAATNVSLEDPLPPGLRFLRFIQNPAGACSYSEAARRLTCGFVQLGPGVTGEIAFAVRSEPEAANTVLNTATISTVTAGDDPTNNSASATTAIEFPDPGVAIAITPVPFPVGSSGAIAIGYQNHGTGVARAASLSIDLPDSPFSLDNLPAGCSFDPALRKASCALGDLAATVSGTLNLPLSIPANYPVDSFSATATISSLTPERPATLVDNTAGASVPIIRPNVYVDASGPDKIVGQGSVFWYVVDYGNIHWRNPALTRTAEHVRLRATLPPDVEFVEASVEPSGQSGQELSWDLGTLNPQVTGRITLVVQTKVPAGAGLEFIAEITTDTPGDDPADNIDTVLTDVVQPPAAVPPGTGRLRLAIHSDLDPRSGDSSPLNAVYLSEGRQIAWPTGEVLDFTPQLAELRFDDDTLPFPYEYRARAIGWSIAGFDVNGHTYSPGAADARGRFGCRPGMLPAAAPRLLTGCTYAYLGGDSFEALRSPVSLREDQLESQAHVYWTQPPAPPMRDDVYLYTVDPLEPARISVQVEIEVWIVNAYPGEIDGITLPEIPVLPIPDPERQLVAETFDVTLLVPRSIVGPGSISR